MKAERQRPQTSRCLSLAGETWLVLLLLACLAPGVARPDALRLESEGKSRQSEHDTGLAALLNEFARLPGIAARFREQKQLELLVEPLLTEGEIFFAPPDLLLRHTQQPIESMLLVRGQRLSFRNAYDSHTIDLRSAPTVGVFVESFRLLLVGDLDGLQSLYDIDYAEEALSNQPVWRIRLTPRRPPLSDAISWIRVSGKGMSLTELDIVERRGDRTLTRFSDVDSSRRFAEGELEAKFESR